MGTKQDNVDLGATLLLWMVSCGRGHRGARERTVGGSLLLYRCGLLEEREEWRERWAASDRLGGQLRQHASLVKANVFEISTGNHCDRDGGSVSQESERRGHGDFATLVRSTRIVVQISRLQFFVLSGMIQVADDLTERVRKRDPWSLMQVSGKE